MPPKSPAWDWTSNFWVQLISGPVQEDPWCPKPSLGLALFQVWVDKRAGLGGLFRGRTGKTGDPFRHLSPGLTWLSRKRQPRPPRPFPVAPPLPTSRSRPRATRTQARRGMARAQKARGVWRVRGSNRTRRMCTRCGTRRGGSVPHGEIQNPGFRPSRGLCL